MPPVKPRRYLLQDCLWGLLFLAGIWLVWTGIVTNVSVDNAGSDREWLMYSSQAWLEGKTLFGNLFDTNPPLIVWLYALPIDVIIHLGLKPGFQQFAVLGIGVVIASLIVCLRLMAYHPQFSGNTKKQAEFALLFCFTFIFSVNPLFFFLRDHIFMLLTFPYMLRFMPSLAGAPIAQRLRIVVGCMAAVGFCIKPHCLIFMAFIGVMYLVSQHSLKIITCIENTIIYTAWVVYLVAIWYFTPDYFDVVVPMLLVTYSACNAKQMTAVFMKRPLRIFVVTFITYNPGWLSPYRNDIFYLLGLCAAAVVYIVVNNGWQYTYEPVTLLVVFSIGWVIWAAAFAKRDREARNLESRGAVFCLLLCGFALALNVKDMLDYDRPILNHVCDLQCAKNKALIQILRDNHARSFGTITFGFAYWPYARRVTDTRWVTRFNNLWMLNYFFPPYDKETPKDQWIPAYVGQKLAEDLDHEEPDIVFLENLESCTQVANITANLTTYFLQYAEFKKAFGHYKHIGVFDLMAIPDSYMRANYSPYQYDDVRYFNTHHVHKCLYDIYKRTG